jgi:AcrR family transcriptional regulator
MADASQRRRAPRSDGIHNRDRILEAAARAFATDGPDATLNSIARDAGVGIATLFRHFPTREDLVEEAYSNSLEHLCSAADNLLEKYSALEATRRWMGRYLDYMSQKRGMAETIRTLLTDDIDSRVGSIGRLTSAVTALLEAGQTAGLIRQDARADDVLAALAGIAVVAGRPTQRVQADRLVEYIIEGIRRT